MGGIEPYPLLFFRIYLSLNVVVVRRLLLATEAREVQGDRLPVVGPRAAPLHGHGNGAGALLLHEHGQRAVEFARHVQREAQLYGAQETA